MSASNEFDGTILLATNGKIDASLPADWNTPLDSGAPRRYLRRDVGTQILLPLFTLAHAPRARAMAVIGHGSGMSSHVLLGSPHAERVTTIEIEPAMVVGARAFHPANARTSEDPRSRIVIDDARAHFAAGRTRYDLILSEPSNPWVSGVSGLFTTEFYRRIAGQLTDDGVFGQWFHLYEIDDALVLGILSALHENFGAWEIFQTAPNDMIVIATRGATLPTPDWSVVTYPGIAADLAPVVPLTEESLETLRVAGRATFAPLLDGGRIRANSDFQPILDLGAERGRFLGSSAPGFTTLHSWRFDPFAALEGRRLSLSIDQRTATPEIAPSSAAVRSARLRANVDPARDSIPVDGDLAMARYRKGMLDAFMAAGAPPPDWEIWFRSVNQTDGELHGQAAGHADEAFHAALRRYLVRAGAPANARAAADFLHGVAVWDWPAVARAAEVLIAAANEGETWMLPEMLRDGAVVARLKLGDAAGARQAFDRFTTESMEWRDLRARLLDAHIARAQEQSPP